jgi:hypothetical protein
MNKTKKRMSEQQLLALTTKPPGSLYPAVRQNEERIERNVLHHLNRVVPLSAHGLRDDVTRIKRETTDAKQTRHRKLTYCSNSETYPTSRSIFFPAASAFVSSLVMALLFRLPNAVFPLRLLLSCCSDSSPDSSYSSQFCFTLFSSIWILLWSSLVLPSSCSSLLPQDLDSLFAFLRICSSLYCFFGFFLLFLAAEPL